MSGRLAALKAGPMLLPMQDRTQPNALIMEALVHPVARHQFRMRANLRLQAMDSMEKAVRIGHPTMHQCRPDLEEERIEAEQAIKIQTSKPRRMPTTKIPITLNGRLDTETLTVTNTQS